MYEYKRKRLFMECVGFKIKIPNVDKPTVPNRFRQI